MTKEELEKEIVKLNATLQKMDHERIQERVNKDAEIKRLRSVMQQAAHRLHEGREADAYALLSNSLFADNRDGGRE